MQVLKEEILPLFTKPHDPRKAKVGKLYELRLNPVELDADPLEFYVFDIQGNYTNKTWTPGADNYCMVLEQQQKHVVVLVGEDIIHISKNEPFWEIELVPLNESSNQHDS
jgi:hypothetical protein